MNSYSGGTTVNGSADYVYNPILLLGNDRALGSGSLNLAGGGSLTVKAVSKADDIYNASRIISNGISIATGVSGVFDAGTNSVTSLDGSLTNIVTNNMTLTGAISGQGSLVKTNNGNLILTGPLSYAGATTVMDGNLVVVKTNLTATVSSNTVGIYFSNNVSAGTYAVLPGVLNGTYSEATYNNLSQGQSASFNASTGSVTVTGNPTSSGPSFADSYPGQSMTDLASNGLSYLMNYALGGSSANGISVPVSSTDSSTLSITAIVRINDSKCQIVGEASTSLTAWPTNSPISGVPAADQSGAVAGVTQKQVFSVNRGTDLKKFLRLKAIHTQ
jgi:autotransporter-associated beta strand protein